MKSWDKGGSLQRSVAVYAVGDCLAAKGRGKPGVETQSTLRKKLGGAEGDGAAVRTAEE